MKAKDKNGKEILIGDTVNCAGLHFVIESFESIVPGEVMACGDCGNFNVDLLEKVDQ